MRVDDKSTQDQIREAGKEEFLEKSFKDASLRNIAKNANVTTGAIYGYYKDKNALFTDLVEPAASRLVNDFKESQQYFNEISAHEKKEQVNVHTNKSLASMIKLLYDNYDAFKLISCSSAGTDYEEYIHELVKIEAESTLKFIESLKENNIHVNDVSENLAHILANSYINSMFEVIIHDMPWSEAVEYIISLTEFFGVGWAKVMGIDFWKESIKLDK